VRKSDVIEPINSTPFFVFVMDPPQTPVAAPQRSLNSQVVLEEDEYTAALSHIIARDFFPSLVHLDATNDYLDAIHSRDPHLINASVRRLEQISQTPSSSRLVETPSQTPFGVAPSETPLRSRGEPPHKRPKLNTELSLDAFQARHTSEDNSSFTDILDDENRRRKEKWAWAWDAQKRVEGQRERMIESRERMMIEAPPATGVRERLVIDAAAPVGLLADGSEDERSNEKRTCGKDAVGAEASNKDKQVIVAKSKDSEAEVDVMAPIKDTRSAGVDGWKFKVYAAPSPLRVFIPSSHMIFVGSKFLHVFPRRRRVSLPAFSGFGR
jgi:protein DGCR14